MNQINKQPLSVSAKVAFEMLGIPASTGYRLIEDGTIPVIRLSQRKMIVPMAALNKLLSDK